MSATQTSTTHKPAGSKLNAKRERVATALRVALSLHTHSDERWKRLITEGATDDEISHHLTDEFGGGSGGGSQTEGGIQFAFKGLPVVAFWLDTSSVFTTAKPTLQGGALVKRVREVMKIPQPVASSEASPEVAEVDDKEIIYVAASRFNWDYSGGTLSQSEGDIARSYSADKIVEGKIRKPFEHEGNLYVNTGGYGDSNGDGCEVVAWRLVPLAEYEGKALSYAETSGTSYEGIRVKSGRVEYVLTGPQVTFKTTTADDDSTITAHDDVVEDSPRTFKSTVEVLLTDTDIAVKARLLSHKRVQIEELQAEKKQTDEGYKAKIGGLEEECSEIYRAIRSGRDELELDVYERRDYDRKIVETVRVDSLDVVESRPMRPTEYQMPLVSL